MPKGVRRTTAEKEVDTVLQLLERAQKELLAVKRAAAENERRLALLRAEFNGGRPPKKGARATL